jgi:hypothetical protein
MSQPRARAPQPPGQCALWSEDPDPPPMTPEQLDKWAERIAKLMGVKLDPARWKKSRRKPPPS